MKYKSLIFIFCIFTLLAGSAVAEKHIGAPVDEFEHKTTGCESNSWVYFGELSNDKIKLTVDKQCTYTATKLY